MSLANEEYKFKFVGQNGKMIIYLLIKDIWIIKYKDICNAFDIRVIFKHNIILRFCLQFNL